MDGRFREDLRGFQEGDQAREVAILAQKARMGDRLVQDLAWLDYGVARTALGWWDPCRHVEKPCRDDCMEGFFPETRWVDRYFEITSRLQLKRVDYLRMLLVVGNLMRDDMRAVDHNHTVCLALEGLRSAIKLRGRSPHYPYVHNPDLHWYQFNRAVDGGGWAALERTVDATCMFVLRCIEFLPSCRWGDPTVPARRTMGDPFYKRARSDLQSLLRGYVFQRLDLAVPQADVEQTKALLQRPEIPPA